tara:strand:- start:596 stop:862 length:267 start_codon:yes stop_codon:yes gene_type:complete
MSKTIKQIADEMYTKQSEYEQNVRKELSNLENLLRMVGGTGDIVKTLDMDLECFLEVLFRNGITFKLTEEKKQKLGHNTGKGTEIVGP